MLQSSNPSSVPGTPLSFNNASAAITTHFDELKRELSNFSTAYNEWLESKRRPLVEEKEGFLKTMSEEHGNKFVNFECRDHCCAEEAVRAAGKLEAKDKVWYLHHLCIDIEREQQEYVEICQTNVELAKQQSLLSRKLDQLKTEMASLQVGLEQRKQEYEMAVADHEAETSRKEVKLKLYQELLGLEIETVKENVMQFNYRLIDPQAPERVFSVTLDVNGEHYLVSDCRPALPELPSILAQLNQSRDFYAFIKTIRAKFRQTVV